MRLGNLLFFLFLSVFAQGQNFLSIGLFYGIEPASASAKCINGNYEVVAQGNVLFQLTKGQTLSLRNAGSGVNVQSGEIDYGTFQSVKLRKRQWNASLKITPNKRGLKPTEYLGSFTVWKIGKGLRIVNNVYIEHYIGGVVEAEAGGKRTLEYYKVQSIICRTYALSNRRKHIGEGFNLCDQVHCQVNHGRAHRFPLVPLAVKETHELVLVDPDIRLITAAFHSNCGGRTVNSEDVWTSPLPYLKSVDDPFCITMPHAHWEKEISLSKWQQYFARKYSPLFADSTYLCDITEFCPDGRRILMTPFIAPTYMKKIRYDWRLSSALFDVDILGDTVILQGQGYGHGVGLCQEGAIHMAELGYSYKEILHHYYTDVHLISLKALDFFRSE